ncbi:MAG: hypothetical protein IJ358_04250 [Clostridia bacterium]|nr:hypothetical protein [Clostridia bacterium]
MTKKTKILIATILIIVTFTTISLVALSLAKVSHCMDINAPSQIVVYYNKSSTNIVFEPNDEEYKSIYSSIKKAYKQPMLKALVDNKLFKDVKIIENDNSPINFKGIKISFVYNTPQVVKYKSKLYNHNGENYWYGKLIFDITQDDAYQYNTVAIIPPENSNMYVSAYSYSLYYSGYCNFNSVYNNALQLFN